MTAPDLPPHAEPLPEADGLAGGELIVTGLIQALTGPTEVIVEVTDTGFDLVFKPAED